jgi:hypothetical protein
MAAAFYPPAHFLTGIEPPAAESVESPGIAASSQPYSAPKLTAPATETTPGLSDRSRQSTQKQLLAAIGAGRSTGCAIVAATRLAPRDRLRRHSANG